MSQAVFQTNAAFLAALAARIDAVIGATSEVPLVVSLEALMSDAERASRNGIRIPLLDVMHRFELSAEEVTVLALALAPELDSTFRDHFQSLSAGAVIRRCTVDIALQLIFDTREDRIDGQRLFRRAGRLLGSDLVNLSEPPLGSTSLLDHELAVVPRVSRLLMGHDELDESLAQYCTLEEPSVDLSQVVLPSDKLREVSDLVRNHREYRRAFVDLGFDEVIHYGRGVAILLSGPPGTGKTLLARALTHSIAGTLLRVLPDRIREAPESVDRILERIFREAAVRDAVVLIDECEALFAARDARLAAMLTALEGYRGLCLMTTSHPERLDPALERRVIYQLTLTMPAVSEREALWEGHLPPGVPLADDLDLALLAQVYEFSGGTIKNAVLYALNRALVAAPPTTLTHALLEDGAKSQLRHNLEEYSSVIRSRVRLDSLILPPEIMSQVQELIGACSAWTYVMNRWGFGRRLVTGRGIVALFDGPPGTGKTLCAEILSNELGQPLFRINVPQIVSKWVGETERNLAEIFKRAKAARSMLLFDEADSLFGSRTEQKSSNDRYANMEVNVLLQEIERYDGVVLLTTNLYGNLDEALKRRLQFRISFPTPDGDQRKRIWERLLPPEAPLAEDVDLARLGKRFELTGGHIKNAVLKAAYRARATGDVITQAILEWAAFRESEALGTVIRDPIIAARDLATRGRPVRIMDPE